MKMKFGDNQLISDGYLIFDFIKSLLRFNNFIKRRPIEFWNYQTRNSIKIKLRKSVWDSAVIIESFWLNVYFRDFAFHKDNSTIIDIGAHIGAFSLLAATKLKKSTIYAFEPDPDNFSLLKKNIAINKLENKIIPFNLAVSDESSQTLSLHKHQDNFGMHSLKYAGKSRKSNTTVKTISLVDFMKKNNLKCDFLKLDCEGYEYPILTSTPVKYLKNIQNIAIEYHSNSEIGEIEYHLQSAGFKTKYDRSIPTPIIGKFVHAPLLKAWR